jgi:hypothetical protein
MLKDNIIYQQFNITLIKDNCKIHLMNQGEKNEILFKIYLTYLKKEEIITSPLGKITQLGFDKKEYNLLDEEIDFENLDDDQEDFLKEKATQLGIEKSSPRNKADIYINNIAFSIKYMDAAPPSIINHTTRIGFVRIAKKLNIDISNLDNLVNEYWELRIANKITEDCGNNNGLSPFKNHKETLRPYLEYFCFSGTGSSDSKHPAQKIIKFTKFNDPTTWKVFSKKETVDEIWDGLYFCMRDIAKGGIKDYENNQNKDILKPWTRFSSEKYRGALSVRYKSK